MLTTYRRKEPIQTNRHSASQLLTCERRSVIGIIFVLLLTCFAMIALLKDSCHVARSLSPPSGLGIINVARRMQWGALQRQTTPLECRRSNKELLIALRDVFERYGITYWLADGTLLGATRNGQMIPHDFDGDMTILQEGWERLRELDSRLPGGIAVPENVKLQILNSSRQDQEDELPVGHMATKRDAAIPVRAYSKDTGWYIDVGIMITATTDDRWRLLREHDSQFSHVPNQTFLQSFAWSSSYQNCMGCMVARDTHSWLRGVAALRVPRDWILPTSQCAFEGEVFACPRKAEAYLAYYYGTKFQDLGDPAPISICSRMADVSSLLGSLVRGQHTIGWKRDDGSRWGNPGDSQPIQGALAEAQPAAVLPSQERKRTNDRLEHFEVTPVGHVMRKQVHRSHHALGVNSDEIAESEVVRYD